jgi:two-component system, sensor histidine kinase and response regulator
VIIMAVTPLQVLIVDDSLEDRAIYRRLLTREHGDFCDIWEAESGDEGLAVCRSKPLDCILLDYRLPDLDGLEFLAALESPPTTASCPVLMLTGCGNEMLVAEAMKAGAMDYLPKNALSARSLHRAIINAVEKFRLQRSVEEHRRALEQKTRELERFHHIVSHELRNPLTVVTWGVEIMRDGLDGPINDQQRERLDIAKESCDQMTLLLNDLLDVTRLETGKFSLSRQLVSIDKVISRAVAAMGPNAQERGISLTSAVVQGLPKVLGDVKRLTQVLMNLLSNALKFTPVGGRVLVKAGEDPRRPGDVVVAVSDSGQGIPREQCEQIFERFYQVCDTDASMKGGLGLGLYICRELVKLHGGEIWVESTPGEGSTFSLTLPKSPSENG